MKKRKRKKWMGKPTKTIHISPTRHIQLQRELVNQRSRTGSRWSLRSLIEHKLKARFSPKKRKR